MRASQPLAACATPSETAWHRAGGVAGVIRCPGPAFVSPISEAVRCAHARARRFRARLCLLADAGATEARSGYMRRELGGTRTYLDIPHGREAGFAGWATRSEERCMVAPYERGATRSSARKAASRPGFVPQAQLRRCEPCEWPPLLAAARALDLRPVETETRLMGNIETGSR
jgi:hypothetical protein